MLSSNKWNILQGTNIGNSKLFQEELSKVASHYKLDVPENVSKVDIRNVVLDYLAEEELIAEHESSEATKG